MRITIETTLDSGEKRIHLGDGILRPYRVPCPEGFGLRREDGKRVIEKIQQTILCDQIAEIMYLLHRIQLEIIAVVARSQFGLLASEFGGKASANLGSP